MLEVLLKGNLERTAAELAAHKQHAWVMQHGAYSPEPTHLQRPSNENRVSALLAMSFIASQVIQ